MTCLSFYLLCCGFVLLGSTHAMLVPGPPQPEPWMNRAFQLTDTPVSADEACRSELLARPGEAYNKNDSWGRLSPMGSLHDCQRCLKSTAALQGCHFCKVNGIRNMCVPADRRCPLGSQRFDSTYPCKLDGGGVTEVPVDSIALTCSAPGLHGERGKAFECPSHITKNGFYGIHAGETITFFKLAEHVIKTLNKQKDEIQVEFSGDCPLAMTIFDCEKVVQSKTLTLKATKLTTIDDSILSAHKMTSMTDFSFVETMKGYEELADAVTSVADDVKLLILGVGTGGSFPMQSHPPFLDEAAKTVKTLMINIGAQGTPVKSGNLEISYLNSYYPVDPDVYDGFVLNTTPVHVKSRSGLMKASTVGKMVRKMKETANTAITHIQTKLQKLKSQGTVCVVMISMGPRFLRYPGLVKLKSASPVFLIQAYDPEDKSNPASVAVPVPKDQLPQKATSRIPWFTMLEATFFEKPLKDIKPEDLGLHK